MKYLLLWLLLILLYIRDITSNDILASAPPYITSVVPSHGGTEGGTRITIFGYNFAQNGIFSTYVVLIGDQPCSVINYYSSDGRIVCLTPKCTASFCRDPTWQGTHDVSLNVYLQTVESILGASTTFSYSGQFTPELMQMSHYTWGTATSFIAGKITAAYLDDVSIFVGGSGNVGGSNSATIGEPGVLNDELWHNSNYWWGESDYPIYYQPPIDMAAGVYNLSLVVQDVENVGWGSGSARTFPVQYPLSLGTDFRHKYLYDAALSGTPYNLILFPAVNRILPAQGSVAGGTILTVSGSGFSTNVSNNIVYAGGRPCTVLSADFNTITCQTSPVEAAAISSFVSNIKYSHPGSGPALPAVNSQWRYNSTRSYGSPGWYVKVWDGNALNANYFPESAIRVSFGLHQGLSFGLYYNVGTDWPSRLGYVSHGYDQYVFVADYTTTIVAPYSGVYYFIVVNVDDIVWLYGSKAGVEELLVYAAYTDINAEPSITQISSGIHLEVGERYVLRARVTNYVGPDNLHLALQIDPDYVNGTLYLSDRWFEKDNIAPDESVSPPLYFSDNFLQHHAVRDIQTMHLSMNYQREVQVFILIVVLIGAHLKF